MSMPRSTALSALAMIFALAALVVALGARVGLPFVGLAAAEDGPMSTQAEALAIPSSFSYQGVLRDTAGELMTGPQSLTVAIYTQAAGGSPLHSETFGNVPVRDGAFEVVLGDGVALPGDLFTAHDGLYVGVRVGADPELTPRQRVHAQPWAMRAENADMALDLADGASVSGLQLSGTKLSGVTDIGGDVTVNQTTRPIIIKHWDRLPGQNGGAHNTGVSINTHICTIGGRAWQMDINEGSNWHWTLIALPEPSTGTWWAHYSNATQNPNPNHFNGTIVVACFAKELVSYDVIDANFVAPQSADEPSPASSDPKR